MCEAIGAAFLGSIKHVKKAKGSDFLELVIKDVGKAYESVFAEPFVAVCWYPYEAYAALLRSIDRHLGTGDLSYLFQVGKVAAQRDVATIYSMYGTGIEPGALIRDCGIIWQTYYRNAGRMEAAAWAPENTVIRIYDFPKMDRAHCSVMEGWMMQMLEGLGVKIGPNARETQCMSKGGPYHEFKCTWRH